MRVAVAALAVLIAAATAGATPAPTRIAVFRPIVHGKVAKGLKVVRTAGGRCFSGSLADPRRNAWRCMIGDEVADPCFSAAGVSSWVICPNDGTPFGVRVTRIALSKALPRTLANHGAPGDGNPWVIKLVGGKVCTFLTGATFAYRGLRVNYGCDRDTFLAGSPDRSQRRWTIALGTGPKSKPRRAAIAVAAW